MGIYSQMILCQVHTRQIKWMANKVHNTNTKLKRHQIKGIDCISLIKWPCHLFILQKQADVIFSIDVWMLSTVVVLKLYFVFHLALIHSVQRVVPQGQCMGIKYACKKWYFLEAYYSLHLLKSQFLWNLWCYINYGSYGWSYGAINSKNK